MFHIGSVASARMTTICARDRYQKGACAPACLIEGGLDAMPTQISRHLTPPGLARPKLRCKR